MTQQKAVGTSLDDSPNPTNDLSTTINVDLATELSQSSIVSVPSSDDINTRQSQALSQSTHSSLSGANPDGSIIPKALVANLDKLDTVADIEAHVEPGLSQLNVLSRLEKRWGEISSNLDNVIEHLQVCSDDVTTASISCLESFKEVTETTCDKVDDETRTLYHLITKCDELTTKLSVASSFRDEIKTLKKSVETLENLYKSRPQRAHVAAATLSQTSD